MLSLRRKLAEVFVGNLCHLFPKRACESKFSCCSACLWCDDSALSFYQLLFLVMTCCVCAYKRLTASVCLSTPSPASLSVICRQPPCCFVYFMSLCICSICICMSKHARAHPQTLMQVSLFSASDDRFPFECCGCQLKTPSHSQKWAFNSRRLFVNAEGEFATDAPRATVLEGRRIRRQFNRKSNLHSYYLPL